MTLVPADPAAERREYSIIPLICVDLNGRISFRPPYLVTLHLVGKHVLPKMVTLFSNAGLSQLSGVPRFGALGVLCS